MQASCLVAAVLVLCACTPSTPAAVESRAAVVERVVDGDTVRLTDGESVRILGIDSPETKDPRKGVQCGGPESAAWAGSVLPAGSTVRLEFDPGREQRDRYDRTLAYVLFQADEEWKDFSVESARLGHSRNYVYDKRPVSKQDLIAAAESEAKTSKLGLWSCSENS